MSRRRRVIDKKEMPDEKYNNENMAKFIKKVMKHGKKSLARRIVYESVEKFSKKVSEESVVDAFEKALENAKPQIEVKSRRIGGATYQVPVEIPQDRKRSLAMKWIIKNAKAKPGRNMIEGLSLELQDCYHRQGATINNREQTHRMAEANKAFAHYKW